MILYIFGHHDAATKIGNELIPHLECVWSLRATRLIYLYSSLAITARLRDDKSLKGQFSDLLRIVEKYKARIVEWQSQCDVNYLMWSLLIDAELCELRQQYQEAIQAYEAAIDHAQLHDFNLDLAVILESQAGFFIRQGGRRAAVATLKDAMAVFSRIGAMGKVEQMATKHEFMLHSCGSLRTQDAAVQTDTNIFGITNNEFHLYKEDQLEGKQLDDRNAIDRTKAWVLPSYDENTSYSQPSQPDLGLDILDLTSILKFSQAISSELDIDKLLVKMMEIILSSAGSQSDVIHIVTESEGEWQIAATGTSDGVSSAVSARQLYRPIQLTSYPVSINPRCEG